MLVLASGSAGDAADRIRQAVELCGREEPDDLGHEPARLFVLHRHRWPLVRDRLVDAGFLVDSVDVSARWSAIPALLASTTVSVEQAIGAPSAIGWQVTGTTSDGASLWMTVRTQAPQGAEIELWRPDPRGGARRDPGRGRVGRRGRLAPRALARPGARPHHRDRAASAEVRARPDGDHEPGEAARGSTERAAAGARPTSPTARPEEPRGVEVARPVRAACELHQRRPRGRTRTPPARAAGRRPSRPTPSATQIGARPLREDRARVLAGGQAALEERLAPVDQRLQDDGRPVGRTTPANVRRHRGPRRRPEPGEERRREQHPGDEHDLGVVQLEHQVVRARVVDEAAVHRVQTRQSSGRWNVRNASGSAAHAVWRRLAQDQVHRPRDDPGGHEVVEELEARVPASPRRCRPSSPSSVSATTHGMQPSVV